VLKHIRRTAPDQLALLGGAQGNKEQKQKPKSVKRAGFNQPFILGPYKKVPSFIAIFASIKNSITILNTTITAEDPAPSSRCLSWLNCHRFLLCPLGKQQWALFFGEESTILRLQYEGGGFPIPLKGHLLTQVAFIF